MSAERSVIRLALEALAAKRATVKMHGADHRVAGDAVQHPAQHVVLLDYPGLKPECVGEPENLSAVDHCFPLFAQPAGHHSRQRVTRCRHVRAGSSFALPVVSRSWQAVIASAGPPRRSRRKPSRLKTAPLPNRSAVVMSFRKGLPASLRNVFRQSVT